MYKIYYFCVSPKYLCMQQEFFFHDQKFEIYYNNGIKNENVNQIDHIIDELHFVGSKSIPFGKN